MPRGHHLTDFVYQDVTKLSEQMYSYVNPVAKFVTDTAAKGEQWWDWWWGKGPRGAGLRAARVSPTMISKRRGIQKMIKKMRSRLKVA